VSGKRLTPSDAVFLLLERPETMMHVAALLPFTPPEDASPTFLRDLIEEIRGAKEVHSPWNVKLWTPELLANPLQSWVVDEKLDLDYHVRRTALPSPGDERELGVLVSRLHSNAIDLHRPPWEVHLIEGLENRRFALFVKVHHSLVDGYTAQKILARSLVTDAADRKQPMFFSLAPKPPTKALSTVRANVTQYFQAAGNVARALARLTDEASGLVGPLDAPRCILNKRIGRSRRFATQKLPTARLRAVARAAGGTMNDVVLALSAASLRRYLLELDALPAKPLIAMVPVNVRPKDDPGGGNAVGAMLASLATDIAEPGARLAAIIAGTKRAKEQLQGMSREAILSYSALLTSPFMLQLVPGAAGRVRPAFNVVISNVPGSDEPLYFRGARLEATFPLSIPVHGLALNITCGSYAGTIDFGFIGCRETLPHLQRLAVHCGEAMTELESAFAVTSSSGTG
jgi:WS/DGAT/MGAT family acyltransferase